MRKKPVIRENSMLSLIPHSMICLKNSANTKDHTIPMVKKNDSFWYFFAMER